MKHIRTETQEPDLLALIDALETFMNSKKIRLVPGTPGRLAGHIYRANAWLDRIITRTRLKAALIGGLAALGIWSLIYPLRFIFQIQVPEQLQFALADLVNQGMIRTTLGLHGLELRLALEISVSLIYIVSAVFLATRYERRGLNLGFVGLVFSLAVVDMVVFYFNQFTTIGQALVQTAVLLGMMVYRQRFILR
jgi:hypothetical protein